jgi:hypothetical protein
VAILLAAIGIHCFPLQSQGPNSGVGRLDSFGSAPPDIINITLREALKSTGAGILSGTALRVARQLFESLLAGVHGYLGHASQTLAGSLPPALTTSRMNRTVAMRP